MSSSHPPITFCAPAPTSDDEGDDGPPEVEFRDQASDDHLDVLCEQLVWWCRTRRFYGSPKQPASVLGQLAKRTRPLRPGGPDADCSAQLAALYIAVIAQPPEALDRQVFELHYFMRVGNVKVAAAQLKIGRQHWYTLLREFRRRIYAASCSIMQANDAALAALPHREIA